MFSDEIDTTRSCGDVRGSVDGVGERGVKESFGGGDEGLEVGGDIGHED